MHKIFKIAIILLVFFNSFGAKTQSLDSYIDSIVGLCSYDSVLQNLTFFEEYGIKTPGSEDLNNTADWIISRHQYFGYEDIQRDTFIYNGHELYNIVVTKTGTTYPNQYLIVDGHYDTYGGPGANDNGSGVSIIMEVARLMQSIETEYSVKFIYFSAEEQGLVGSNHYVDNTVIPENMDILLVFNIDEVGGVNGMSNTIITCERDEGPPTSNNELSAAYTDTLASCVGLYSNLSTSIYYAYGSDYMPFEDAGEIITGLYEYNESPYPHGINDSISNLDVDYVFEIAKASTGASLYFSKAYKEEDTTNISVISLEEQTSSISLYPNPVQSELNFELSDFAYTQCKASVYTTYGQIVFEEVIDAIKKRNRLNVKHLPKGFYLLKLEFDNKTITQKFLKQ